jgi:hypothetical protein
MNLNHDMILSILRKLLRLPRPKLFSTESVIIKKELILIFSLLFIFEIEPPSSQVVPRNRVTTTTKLKYLLCHEPRPLKLQWMFHKLYLHSNLYNNFQLFLSITPIAITTVIDSPADSIMLNLIRRNYPILLLIITSKIIPSQ